MTLFLGERNTELQEKMDAADCDRSMLENTYRQFRLINALVSRWHRIYRDHILGYAQNLDRPCRILDIGFGGGDIPLKLAQWCREDGIEAEITAIETDERAYAYSQTLPCPDNLSFLKVSSGELVREGVHYDFVISNHLLHHLQGESFFEILEHARSLSRHRVLFNDIERSDLGYALFSLITLPIFRESFIRQDGITSIRRSYTFRELQAKVPPGWSVERIVPYRLLLSYTHG